MISEALRMRAGPGVSAIFVGGSIVSVWSSNIGRKEITSLLRNKKKIIPDTVTVGSCP